MISSITRELFQTTARQFAKLSPSIIYGAKTAVPSIQRAISTMQTSAFSTNGATPKEHIVVALGGNALLKRKEATTMENQRQNIVKGMTSLHNVLNDYKVTLVHGNGPQVGLLANQAANYESQSGVTAMKLDVLDAETEGMIGYLLEQEIHAHLPQDRGVATILTQMVVDPKDPAFENPTKFIGPVYTLEEAQEKLKDLPFKKDGQYYRRVVPSPFPVRMVEQQFRAVRQLTDADCLVICAGGGGIPVIGPDEQGRYTGVEAVIDKDRAASWVGSALGANGLLILTDVDAVELEYGSKDAKAIRSVAPSALAKFKDHFPAGSMGPKVDAAIEFVKETGAWAAIGNLDNVDMIMARKSGTWIEPHWDGDYIDLYPEASMTAFKPLNAPSPTFGKSGQVRI